MPVIQAEFSRFPPSQEDEYFYELEHRQELSGEELSPGSEWASDPIPEELSGFWARLYLVLTRNFDSSWQP